MFTKARNDVTNTLPGMKLAAYDDLNNMGTTFKQKTVKNFEATTYSSTLE